MRKPPKPALTYTATALAVGLAMTACGGGTSEGQAIDESGELVVEDEVIASAELLEAALDEGSVNVYTSLNEVSNDAIASAFEEDTGISVSGVRTPTGRLHERIRTEAGGGNLAADIIAMPDESLWQELVESGLFGAHEVPSHDLIPEEFTSPDGLYYALNSAPTVIAYNTEVIDPDEAPTSWRDLPEVGRQGHEIGVVHASQGAGGWGLALFMRQAFGEGYWEELAESGPVLESSVGALAERLGRGEIAVAAARVPEVGGLQEQGAPVEFVWPSDGTPTFNFYIAQVAEADHPNAAQVYLNWAMSKRGQSVVSQEGLDFPVHPEATTAEINGEQLPTIDEVDVVTAASEDWISLRDDWIAEWNGVFGYRQ
ncbi:ABC transporter substrate-binding protein [Streptomyces profundus]|uniref:ABC transporter substrate-binding protein n=1 Tax=Streptomyces profundus TaxID=2867410 RepID=UPI001D164011|nr:extracellular solute-binding protein [Streptomyces sp. MA3_2.13]UED84695.1 extracellular solute-binding protein [Streptomyces sp. MA3_2.13]